jgi:hypothetical protein
MVARKIAVALMFGAACLMVSTVQAADKKKGEHGTIVSVDANKLVVTNKAGEQKTYDVSPNVSVTVKGEPAKITDLKAGDKIGFKLDDAGKAVVTISSGHKPKT